MKKNYFLVAILSFVMFTMNAQFEDDMESYADGERIYEAHWTDWACDGDCAIWSSSNQAHEGGQSGYIWGDPATDLVDGVLDLGSKIFGEWGLSFYMYVTPDMKGYFNLQNDIPIGSGSWIVGNLYFNQTDTPGVGNIDDSALGLVEFNYPEGEWFRVVMNWDISSGISAATWQLNIAGVDVLPEGTPFTNAAGDVATALGGFDFYSGDAQHDFYVDTFEYLDEFIELGTSDLSAKGFRSAMSNGTLTLKAQENINSVAIYNMLGQQVYNANINAMQSTVDMSNLSNGTYIVKLNINGTEGSVKVIR